jgi:hypothetical protein
MQNDKAPAEDADEQAVSSDGVEAEHDVDQRAARTVEIGKSLSLGFESGGVRRGVETPDVDQNDRGQATLRHSCFLKNSSMASASMGLAKAKP